MHQKLVPLLAAVIGCAPASVEAPPQLSTTARGPQEPVAREVVRGARPWAAEDLRIPPGKLRFSGELFAELSFVTRAGAPQRLSPDTLGFLEFAPGQYTGVRVLATRQRVQRIEEPKGLSRFCVARDGKATFAVGENNTLLHATAFDAPMRPLGRLETETNGAYFAYEAGTRRFIDCRRGTIDDVSNLRGYPRIMHHSEAVTLIAFNEDQRRSCRMRAGSSTAWEDVARCSYAGLYADGLVRVFVDTPDGASTKCAFAIDGEGKRRPCGDMSVSMSRSTPHESPIDFRSARFASQSLLVTIGEKGLYVMPAIGNRSDLKLVATGLCAPVLPIAPLFRCISEERRSVRIVAIDAEGKAKDELTLPIRGERDELRFFETAGGALATGGECDGTPGDVACVRQPSGEWKSIPFADDLVKALHRTAPGTVLLPTVSGELFVGTGVSDTPLGMGPVELLVYQANKGLVTRIEKAPRWILGDMAGPSGLASSFLSHKASQGQGPSFLWRSAATFSAWPLMRPHPAFRTPESCRFDVSLDGSTSASCISGQADAVGRFGVVERKRGELLETYDAGETWFQVPLPEGVDTRDVDCAAIGCRIGPYFRMGWGI